MIIEYNVFALCTHIKPLEENFRQKTVVVHFYYEFISLSDDDVYLVNKTVLTDY